MSNQQPKQEQEEVSSDNEFSDLEIESNPDQADAAVATLDFVTSNAQGMKMRIKPLQQAVTKSGAVAKVPGGEAEEGEEGDMSQEFEGIESVRPVRWLACDYSLCGKWRKIPDSVDDATYARWQANAWFCYMNSSDIFHSACQHPEETYVEPS